MVGSPSHILKSEGWGASTFFSEEGYPKCKWSLRALQRTTGKAQSLVNPLGHQALLSVPESARECAWWGRLRWGRGGIGKREERDSTQWLCGGDLLCLLPPLTPLSLCFFSVLLSLSPFPRPLLLHLSGRILECSFDRLNLSLALEFWLAEGLRGGKNFN